MAELFSASGSWRNGRTAIGEMAKLGLTGRANRAITHEFETEGIEVSGIFGLALRSEN